MQSTLNFPLRSTVDPNLPLQDNVSILLRERAVRQLLCTSTSTGDIRLVLEYYPFRDTTTFLKIVSKRLSESKDCPQAQHIPGNGQVDESVFCNAKNVLEAKTQVSHANRQQNTPIAYLGTDPIQLANVIVEELLEQFSKLAFLDLSNAACGHLTDGFKQFLKVVYDTREGLWRQMQEQPQLKQQYEVVETDLKTQFPVAYWVVSNCIWISNDLVNPLDALAFILIPIKNLFENQRMSLLSMLQCLENFAAFHQGLLVGWNSEWTYFLSANFSFLENNDQTLLADSYYHLTVIEDGRDETLRAIAVAPEGPDSLETPKSLIQDSSFTRESNAAVDQMNRPMTVDSMNTDCESYSENVLLQLNLMKRDRQERNKKLLWVEDKGSVGDWKSNLYQMYPGKASDEGDLLGRDGTLSRTTSAIGTTVGGPNSSEAPAPVVLMCQHSSSFLFANTEFTILSEKHGCFVLEVFGHEINCPLKPNKFSWVGALVVLRNLRRRPSCIRHVFRFYLALSPVPGGGGGEKEYIVHGSNCIHARFRHSELRTDWLGRLALSAVDGGIWSYFWRGVTRKR